MKNSKNKLALPKKDTSTGQPSSFRRSLLIPFPEGGLQSLGSSHLWPRTPLTWPSLLELLTWIADAGIYSSCTNPLSLMDDFNLFNFCPACEKTESMVGRGREIEVAGQELSGG